MLKYGIGFSQEPGSENEYVESGEYVQDDPEPFQAEDITGKMI